MKFLKNPVLKILLATAVLLGLLSSLLGCSGTTTPTTTATQPTKPANPELILSSTTSTRDSGLFDVLIPMFEEQTGYKLKSVYVGSGAAMAMGAQGEADVLVVHSPAAEVTFMNDSSGINRQLLMHTDYLIVGPKSDPGGIKGMPSAVEAFKKMAEAQVTFYSRGDNSGTDTTDKKIWKSAGVTVADGSAENPSWYIEGGAGTGMATLLNVASEKQAYTLTDRATYLNNMSTLDLDILVEGDPILLNVYHVIQVNPAKWPKVNAEGAKAFSDFLLSAATQDVIAKYGIDRFGKPLFFADAGKAEPVATATATATATESISLTVVNGSTTKTYTLSAFKALPATAGSGMTKNKAGTISTSDKYVGVSLIDLINAVGGMKDTQSVNVIASDGYISTLTYAQIYQGTFNIMDKDGNPATATQQPVVVLVYLKAGVALDAKSGPIQMGIMTATDQVSEASVWVKQVVKIEIVNP
ncbi:MAG: substrate-binding domain-containing protein [Dehalococcoidales bacterium]|nr:substrate-binding domain-containing protein [Dehalococcoidales bacterium]